MSSSKSKASAPQQCKWSGCEAYQSGAEFASVDELARHVRVSHVEPFESQDIVFCQWEGCKVYNVPSSSIQWLRRHVQQSHTKDRPFKCIMNGCNMSFNSREALQRHVNRHLEPTVASGSTLSTSPGQRHTHTKTAGKAAGKVLQSKHSHYSPFGSSLHAPLQLQLYHDTPPRHFEIPSDSSFESSDDSRRRLGPKKCLHLKVRIPRRVVALSHSPQLHHTPYNGAHVHTDVWDRKMMSVVRQACKQLVYSSSTSLSITLKATILGQRQCSHSSEKELLVRWSPPLAEDSWVSVSQFSPKKSIPFSDISEPYLSQLASLCFPYPKMSTRHNKRKS